MNTERPIREWYDLLREPERSEANAARDRAEARNPRRFPKGQMAASLHDSLMNGFAWERDGMDGIKWSQIHARASRGAFDAPSEVDRLRARVAELEGALRTMLEWEPATRWGMDDHAELESDIAVARTILNKK